MTEQNLNTDKSNSTKPVLTTVFLAPYLPYKIKGSQERNKTIFYLDTFSNMRGKGIESRTIDTWINNDIKPILRPIEDVFKKIEIDGETFRPSVKLNFHLSFSSSEELFNDIKKEIISVKLQRQLIEWHFDVFGLIEKGLAISIHDIE
jgi:hypothetical protein